MWSVPEFATRNSAPSSASSDPPGFYFISCCPVLWMQRLPTRKQAVRKISRSRTCGSLFLVSSQLRMRGDLLVPGRAPLLLFPAVTCASFQPFLIPSLVIIVAAALLRLCDTTNSAAKVGIEHRHDLHPLVLAQHLGAPHNLDYLPYPPSPSFPSYSFHLTLLIFLILPSPSAVLFAHRFRRIIAASADISHVLDNPFITVFSVCHIYS